MTSASEKEKMTHLFKKIRPKILVVDDEESIREFLQIMLKRERIDVVTAKNGLEGLEKYEQEAFDLVISDVKMPKMTGPELLEKILEKDPQALVLMITAFGSTEIAVEAMKKGAYDYLSKPFKIDDVKHRIYKALEARHLVQDNVRLKKELGERYSFFNIVGSSEPMQNVFELIRRVSKTDSSVLIEAESGTGKELVAKAVHYNSERKDGPFVSVNCGAISENLVESEFFGHKKGSFTGAVNDKKGYLEVADGGTLFLDEVGEMPMNMQVSLLRVLADNKFTPVGGTEAVASNFRIVAATNRSLQEEVDSGSFREDLFFRLNVIKIDLPALRKRKEDIASLVDHFLQNFCERFDKNIKTIPSETMKALKAYSWPGNVRELENVVERMVALESQNALTLSALPEHIREPLKANMDSLPTSLSWKAGGVELEEVLAIVEREFLLKSLEEANGVKKEAAKLLGVSMRSLRYRLEKLGIVSQEDAA